MTYRFLNTAFPTDGCDALFQWKQFMTTTVHWTIAASSDGYSAFSNSSDILTSGLDGYNGLNNPNAWFVIQMPTTGRQFCFQRSPNKDYFWSVAYSVSGFLTNGTLNQPPTAGNVNNVNPDQVYLLNPFSQLFANSSSYNYIFNCIADDAPPYGMFWFAYTRGFSTIKITSVFMIDPLLSTSYPSSFDNDPYVFYIGNQISSTTLSDTSSSILGQTYLRRGLDNQVFIQKTSTTNGVVGAAYGLSSSYILSPASPINNQVSNSINEYDDIFPVYYFSVPALHNQYLNYRGVSTFLSYASSLRYNGDLLTLHNNGDCLYLNGIVIKGWNNTTLPIL